MHIHLERGDRVKVSAFLRSVNNAGFAIGATLAGVVVAIDTRPAYLALPIGNVVATGVMVSLRGRRASSAGSPCATGRSSG